MEHNSGLSLEDKSKRIKKQKETISKKISNDSEYFVKIEEKRQNTFNERYGMHPLSSPKIRDKIKETVTNRYGYDNVMLSPTIKQKSIATIQDRYGVDNIGQLEETKTKVLNTNLEKYNGHPSSSIAVKNKKKETNISRYGCDTMRIARESYVINHDGKYPSQIHISDDTNIILRNKNKFTDFMKDYSTKEAGIVLGVSDTTILRYCSIHGIERSKSSYETAIIEFLKFFGISVKKNDRILLNGLEIDILLEQYKIGIEFTGFYWHSEKNLTKRNYDAKSYHLNKTKMMNDLGYRLITIFEDEWLFKRKIVENNLVNLLGFGSVISDKISIRNATTLESKTFLELYHIQGYSSGYIKYVALDGDEIIAVMVFRKSRKGCDELIRFATNRNNNEIYSQLFEVYLRDYGKETIYGYSDRRWDDGDVYKQLGFEIVGEMEPKFWYTKRSKIFSSNQKRKIMKESGYDKIWDCGSLIYKWNN